MATPFDFAALYRAWQACRRGKRGTRKAQRYETRLLDNLVDTAQALHTQAWRPSRPIRFVTLHPKPREILAAEFGDRVVHHLLVPWFERLFEPVFIHDSHANRKGHGTHAAVQRLQGFLRRDRSQRLQDEVFWRHPWLGHWLAPLGDGRLRRADRPASVSSLASQWRYFRKRYPDHALLMQVGNRWECALPEPIAARTLREGMAGGGAGLSQRPGLPPTRALSANQLRVLKRRLIQAGQPWCEVAENGYLRGGTKRRQLRAVWPAMPVPGSSFQSKSTERRAPAGLAKTLEAQP